MSETLEEFVARARAGIPLERSPELMELAQRVVESIPNGPAEFTDEWLEGLAADLAKFED